MAHSSAKMPSNLITSSFLISNLHCPSCVSHIRDTLFALDPAPSSVSPSLLTSWVTVQHDSSLSLVDICDVLENAGFDISDVTSDGQHTGSTGPLHTASNGEIGYLDRLLGSFRVGKDEKGKDYARHLQNCEACKLEHEHEGKDGVDTNSPKSPSDEKEKEKGKMASEYPDDEKNLLPFVKVDSESSVETWRASLAIGGMTCAACAGTITEQMEKKGWVKKIVVNLISNSATIDFTGAEHKNDLVESIEDMGFDATVDTIVDLKTTQQASSNNANTPRTVSIRIDGMFCEHCPRRVMTVVEGLGNAIKVHKSPDLKDSILSVTYTPRVPDFTIRTIMAAITSVDPLITPAIHHPPTLEERSRKIHRKEQVRIFIRVLLTLVIAVPTLIIGVIYMSLVSDHNSGKMFLMAPLRAGVSRAQWALFVLATPVYFLCADVFHTRALKEIVYMWKPSSTTPFLQRFYRFGSMNMLMSLGTTIAYVSSLAQLIAAGLNPPSIPNNSSFYFDSVVFLTLFLLIGRLIESYSKSKTGDAVTMLGKLRPSEALLVEQCSRTAEDETTHDNISSINVDLLEYGDIVKVLHGGSPPCDGTIVQGETKFDESSLTGESRLVKKTVGDEVYSGTVNKDSAVSIRITGVAGSSMLDQIVKAVREGQTRRAPMERIADTLTSYFVPVITLIAIGTWIFWLAMGTSGNLPADYMDEASGSWVVWSLQFAIAVFVVACPCGLALAAPTALFVGGGLAAKYGILVKGGGEAFEKASKLDCVVFDKTGTLTMGGEPVVTDSEVMHLNVLGNEAESSKAILGMVSSIESNSSHTLARALVSFCSTKPTTPINVLSIEEIPGQGMRGTFQSPPHGQIEMLIGNELLITSNNVTIPASTLSNLNTWKSLGRSVALAAIKSTSTFELAAMFAISDPIRPEAPSIISALQKRGTDIWMLSGDNQITANAIGLQLDIPTSNIIADVLPSQKAEKISYLQKSLKSKRSATQRAVVAMVGDGINDSPALTTADVGIAIGSGSDIAISSAEFVLVRSELGALVTLLDLSEVVFRRIKFNFAWALVYNCCMVPFAAGVLYPVVKQGGGHVRLDPVWASLSMALSSISVVCSSLMLRSKIPGMGFRVKKLENGEEKK